MAGFGGKLPAVVHLLTNEGKPFCFPSTKATIFKGTKDAKKVTCPKCRERMKIESLPVYISIKKQPDPVPEPEKAKPEETYGWENATVILKGPGSEPVLEDMPGAHVINSAHPDGGLAVNTKVIEESTKKESDPIKKDAISLQLAGKKRPRGRPRKNEDGTKTPTFVFKRTKYVRHKEIKTENGCCPLDIDDETAHRLRALPMDDLFRVVYNLIQQDNAIDDPAGFKPKYNKDRDLATMSISELKEKYVKLRPGVQRMVLGNIYRATYRNIKNREAFQQNGGSANY